MTEIRISDSSMKVELHVWYRSFLLVYLLIKFCNCDMLAGWNSLADSSCVYLIWVCVVEHSLPLPFPRAKSVLARITSGQARNSGIATCSKGNGTND